jgi:organic radical activating enzyme
MLRSVHENMTPWPGPPHFRLAQVHMFETCTHKCGYCWFAESGQVLDFAQLEPFRNPSFIEKVTSFFLSRTTPDLKWLLCYTGGEPLIAPNLDRLNEPLMDAGNRIAFNTALLIGDQHPGFRFLLKHSYPQVDYVMASFHPEAERDEARYFDKIRMLKDSGHKVLFRFVGQPQRLHRLEELSDRCRELDICFYPTVMFSNRYPGAYTKTERERLSAHFSSPSQRIQLEGGFDTTGLQCHGGSRVIGVNLQTGDITACITVQKPSLGNIFEDRLELYPGPIKCPEPGIGCSCDGLYQQGIVIGADDRSIFERQKNGFVPPEDFQTRLIQIRQSGLTFHQGSDKIVGNVVDDTRPFFTIGELQEKFRIRRGLPRTTLNGRKLAEISKAVQTVQTTGGLGQIHGGKSTRIVTPEGMWAYAAAFPLVIPAGAAGEIWVRIRVMVVRGESGFGLLNRSGTAFQDRGFLGASPELQTIYLKVTDPRDLASLIVQNATPDGNAAEITIENVAVFAADDAGPIPPRRTATGAADRV